MGLRVVPRVAVHLFVQGICWCCLAATATAADRPAGSVLHLTNGDFVPGELRGSEDPKVCRWQSPFFTQPLEFPLSAVHAVHYTLPGPQPKPPGEYCFELVSDDVLYGNLQGWSEDDVEVDSARIGRIHLRREQIRRFYRWKGADAIYLGPNGLAGWKDAAATPQWRDEGGQLLTEQWGAELFSDLGIPEKAVIEIELSWKRKPDFKLALGVSDQAVAAPYGFRFEVWDNDLVVLGESAQDADVASVQQVGNGEGQCRVQVFLDQTQGRLILFSRSGKPLATLQIHAKKSPLHSGVRLTNGKGDVRLEHLRISRWNGLPPREIPEDQARLHRTDGSILYGQLVAFDPQSKKFTLRDGMTETLVEQEAIADVFVSPSVAKPLTDPVAGKADGRLRLAYRDGSRFTGTLTLLEDTHLTLTCPGMKEPLRLPLAELRSLIALQHQQGAAGTSVAGKPGRLEMEGVSLNGRLVGGSARADATCLVWHPDLGLNASPLRQGVVGRIVYREPPAPRPGVSVPQGQRMAVAVQVDAGGGVIQRAVPVPRGSQILPGAKLVQPPSSGRRSLHLRTGDTIPCEVLGIDEKGVTFRTALSDATFVAHEKIKSVELIAVRYFPPLDESKRDRLLTLPRLQKDSPPTHLICSTSGDFLRGRVLEMDATRLKVEVRLETRIIPRDRIAQIIWLHPDELTGQKVAVAAADASGANRVQTVYANGNRLTFVAEKADHQTISGRSELLGACRVDLADVDQLLFGTYIEESAAKLAYHLWKLHYATEPKFAQDEASGSADGRLSGIDSPLVGQAAFPFRLDLLDGSKFRLADHKGRVVVLDFWATWCGPCLQTMPLIEGVVREFADRGVELVAVNLEEQPEPVKATLERHKLKIAVALDRDGVVAAKYAVTAIPQTVVIDRDGKVARLFVGGGKKTADALRQALQEVVAGKPTPAAGETRQP